MTSTKTKLRSLFLTALMVTSVFAGTVALSGSAAAAANGSSSVSLSPTDVNSDATVTHSFQIDAAEVDANGNTDTLNVNVPSGAVIDSATISVVNDSSGESVDVDASDVSIKNNGLDIDITPGDGDASSGYDFTLSGTVTVDWPSESQPTDKTVDVIYDDNPANNIDQDVTVTVQGTDNDRGTGSNEYDIADSSGTIGADDVTVFQGEEDITISGATPSEYERSAGSNEGLPLEIPIPEDQPTGSYVDTSTTSDNSITVQTPRVTTLEVTNQNGDDIAGGSVNVDGQTELTIDAEYNYQNAERLDVIVEDSTGLEVTDEVLQNPNNDPLRSSNGELTFALNEDNLDNEEYTVTVEGTDDLDFGPATETVTFDVTTGEDATIEAQADSVTRGENVQFEIGNSAEGETHLVAIEDGDVTGDISSVFRNVGDTLDVGESDDGQAVALIEIDDGVGVGSVSTSELDTTEVDITVYAADVANSGDSLSNIMVEDANEIDDDSFEVNEGSVTLDNPQGTYVVGSEVTVNGSTAPGIEEVALYARDEGDFKYVDTYNVDGDDTFEEEDIDLSSISEVLSIPGTYRIAAVDANDVDVDGDADGSADATLPSSNISSAVGTQSSLRVTDTALTVDYVSIINGQVATDDAGSGLTINGTAPGQNDVSVSFYGPRGTYDRTEVTVDSDGTFDSESVQVGNNAPDELNYAGNGYTGPGGEVTDTGLSQGNVVMSVFSSGRDGQAGDGEFPRNGFSQFTEGLNAQSLTQQQVIDTVASETVEDTGSDDISEVFQFRYTEGRVSVDSVTGEAGEAFTVETNDTMSVSGVTNRQPDDSTITVEVIEGPSASSFDIDSTDMWGTDGQWSVDIPTEGVEPGNYTVEASVGDNSDIRSFQVTGEQLEEPAEPEPTDTATEPEPTETEPEPEPEPEPTTEMQQTEEQTEQQTEAAETTTATGPGFTAVLALVALVAAALLAVRRRD